MKEKVQGLLRGFQVYLRVRRGFAVVAIVSLCLIPSTARAAGLGDILSLLKTITSTIQGAIGGALNDIQDLNSLVNKFREEIVWPLEAINQARAFVTSTRAQYGQLMFEIVSVRNDSAALRLPSQFESIFRSGQASSIGQIQAAYTNVYPALPSPANAKPQQRNMMDMDDALAMGSLKTTVLSDQTTQSVLSLADSIEQQSATAAPGSAPILSTQAQVAELETQALMTKVLAAELRTEATRLAHRNTLLKQSSASTRNLQNQMMQLLSHP
jgi:hypothetical protein